MAPSLSSGELEWCVKQLFSDVKSSVDAGTAIEDLQQREVYPVAFNDIFHWFYSGHKKNAVRKLNDVLSEFEYIFIKGGEGTKDGIKPDQYFLTEDAFKAFALASHGKVGKAVRRYYIALEREYMRLHATLTHKRKAKYEGGSSKRQKITEATPLADLIQYTQEREEYLKRVDDDLEQVKDDLEQVKDNREQVDKDVCLLKQLLAAKRQVDSKGESAKGFQDEVHETREALKGAEETRRAAEEKARAAEETRRAAEETLRAAQEKERGEQETLRAAQKKERAEQLTLRAAEEKELAVRDALQAADEKARAAHSEVELAKQAVAELRSQRPHCMGGELKSSLPERSSLKPPSIASFRLSRMLMYSTLRPSSTSSSWFLF